MTSIMLGLAIEILIWPATISASAFRYMLSVISAENMGVFFLLFGMVRILALIANGNWPKYGPRMRAAGGGFAAFMWLQMFVALIVLVPHNNGIPSPGIPVYFALFIGELISAYRVISDARPPAR